MINLNIDEIGITLKVDFNMDVSTATSLKLYVISPFGISKNFDLTPSGNYGLYSLLAGDFDEVGEWMAFGKAVFPSGQTALSNDPDYINVKQIEGVN